MPPPQARFFIRPETSCDDSAIRAVVEAAFGRATEADLVDALRAEGDAVVSLVAEEAASILGHVMLSAMRAPFRALGLAPLAVLPARQHHGIGTRLVQASITAARDSGYDAIFVLGDSGFYSRFGFSAGAAAGFDCRYAGPFLMALPLHDRGLPSRGVVAYARPFDDIG